MLSNIVFVLLLLQNVGVLIVRTQSDPNCHSESMADFVRDTLPQVCFGSDSVGRLNYSMNQVEFYNSHCRIYQEIKTCLEDKLKRCEDERPGFIRHVLNLVESYQLPLEYFDHDPKIYDDNHYLQNLIPFCDGDKLSGHFSRQFDRSLLGCLAKNTLTKHKQCLVTFKNNIQTVLETKASLKEVTKWSEDFLRCVYNAIPTNCPTATKEIFVFRELLAVPNKHDITTPETSLNITQIVKQKLPSQNVPVYAQSKRATASIHGDPHIVQLHITRAVTCKLLQNRTYIANPHFKITGLSKHVGDPLLTATALTALQIDFFDANGSLIAYYRATNGKLPLKLVHIDSLSPSLIKIDHGEKHSTQGHLTLTHLSTSTQITVNVWDKFYYFLVRSSELLLNNSNGYLITGCPQSDLVDRQAIIARLKERFAQSQRKVVIVSARQRRHSLLQETEIPQQCEHMCTTHENDFVDECIFDCLALATVNASRALRIVEIHSTVTRERRQLVQNDERVVEEFQECYKEGVVCKITEDPDRVANVATTRQTLYTILIVVFSVLLLTK